MLEKEKLSNKNILIVVASKNFRDEEYFIPLEIFQKEGVTVTTASSIKGQLVGIAGGEIRSTLKLREVKTKDFDAIVFIGGDGAKEYFDNNDAHKIICETVNSNRVLAAICIAPVILAQAGVLNGKKATVWSSVMNKKWEKVLKEAGCLVSEKRVEKDEKIITADGPAVSAEFAKTIIATLLEKE